MMAVALAAARAVGSVGGTVFGTHDLWLFVLSGLLLNITPGPDTLYIVGRSSSQGWRAGAVAALGIGTGALVHVCAAALGLSAILAASATAFTAVKIIGAGYLVYVGISLIRSKSAAASPATAPRHRPAPLRGIYFQGSRRLGASSRFKKWFNRCVGSLFVFVGVRLALAHDR
jgi:threonine/homoserine/homoserine lactone efflux protein